MSLVVLICKANCWFALIVAIQIESVKTQQTNSLLYNLFVSSPSAKPSFNLHSRKLRLIIALIVAATGLSNIASSQQLDGRVIVFPVEIQWSKQPSVSRYRLQIAADEKFQDVFFDGRVAGNRYTVDKLPPGSYYWRVAANDSQLGAFSHPVRFFLSGGVVTNVQLPRKASGSR